MNLRRFPIHQINHVALSEQEQQLEKILYQKPESSSFQEAIPQIISFQAPDGSFAFLDSFKVESHLRVAYCYKPTYIATAILMKQYMYHKQDINDELLKKALKACTKRYFKGAGYKDMEGQIEAMGYFICAGVNEFLKEYPFICPEFTQLISDIRAFYVRCLKNRTTQFGINEDYQQAMSKVCQKVGELDLQLLMQAKEREELPEDVVIQQIDEILSDEEMMEEIKNEVPERIRLSERYTYSRCAIVAAKALMRAEYKCEISEKHKTFIRRTNHKPYTEPHHLVPLSAQGDFHSNLDCEANIISLCSHCHNNVHYGEEREKIIEQLYEARKKQLQECGINITFDKLLTYY